MNVRARGEGFDVLAAECQQDAGIGGDCVTRLFQRGGLDPCVTGLFLPWRSGAALEGDAGQAGRSFGIGGNPLGKGMRGVDETGKAVFGKPVGEAFDASLAIAAEPADADLPGDGFGLRRTAGK